MEQEAIDIITELCRLKKWKDKYDKLWKFEQHKKMKEFIDYNRDKAAVWERAFNFLNQLQ